MSDKTWDYMSDDEKREVALGLSEQMARSRYSDYDQVTSEYLHEVRTDEKLADRIMNSPDPGEELYRRAKSANEFSLDDVFKED